MQNYIQNDMIKRMTGEGHTAVLQVIHTGEGHTAVHYTSVKDMVFLSYVKLVSFG